MTVVEEFRVPKDQIDRQSGIIRGVKVLGLESKNRRVYPAHVVKAAVSLYEGAKVNINHPKSGDPTAPRDYRANGFRTACRSSRRPRHNPKSI